MSEAILVAGARPNFMKIAPILAEMNRRTPSLSASLVHTGQHYDSAMSEVFFEQLEIRPPDVHLHVGSGPHGAQTGKLMIAFEEYLSSRSEPPVGVVVVGDVNSTVACAMVAAKLGIPVAHVEAGLRSFDRSMPEEINRIVTDAISDLLLVSDPAGLGNLQREGIPDARVQYVGNVMIDTLVQQLPHARVLGMPRSLGLDDGGYALVTMHRPSNVDDRAQLERVVALLERTSRRLPVVFPVHPRTDARLREFTLRERLESEPAVHLVKPLGYRENLALMANAALVLSDSGGIQEETTFLRVPCITFRDSTERPVTVTSGTNTVVGTDADKAWTLIERVLGGTYPEGEEIPGWDGHAAKRVVDALTVWWQAA